MIRTRQVLKDLSYRSLVRQGLIPDLVNLFSQTPQVLTVKRYPLGLFLKRLFWIWSLYRIYCSSRISNLFRTTN